MCLQYECVPAVEQEYELRVQAVDSSGGNGYAHEYWVRQYSTLLEVSPTHFPNSGPLGHWVFRLPPRVDTLGPESGPAPFTEIEVMRLPLDQVYDDERLSIFEVSLDGPDKGIPAERLHAGEWTLPEYDSPNSITFSFTPVPPTP